MSSNSFNMYIYIHYIEGSEWWNSMKIMKIRENGRKSMKIMEFRDFHASSDFMLQEHAGTLWKRMVFYTFLWPALESMGIMEINKLPWDFVKIGEILLK